jgi:rRNA maturation RNase YbeY
LANAARAALERARARPSELTIVLTDSRRIRRLNARFAGWDAVTDVLAFPSEEKPSGSGRRYLGDVVIALPRARAQARQRGACSEMLLTVHGTLHLIGYDHAAGIARSGGSRHRVAPSASTRNAEVRHDRSLRDAKRDTQATHERPRA